MGGGFLILYFGKYIQILNVQLHFSKILLNFFILFLAAFEEEIFIRGYILNNLMDLTNKYIALIISSIIFSLFHILNFDISWFSLINLFLAGILFGIIYLFTKNLWLPISLHLFWNFFQGPVFGFSVSGQKFPPVFTINELGSSFINGGKFGFEGSVLCTIALILTILLAFLFYKNRFKINIPIRQ
ncbi:CPBP family intramembrane metalloprotease [Candidatus Sulfidibacterium hydrothermale]|uniref:CPBP family intramembrane glutamic endopeptidase n=1 Tax=Candidatus Sulfidibacterium hydrothermale TaxID=2875962 RepID=UPI0037440A66|nr:CPBP family intramembrane metalloprotease [Candidatus Sulfidibacterium hydrothermale]